MYKFREDVNCKMMYVRLIVVNIILLYTTIVVTVT